MEECATCRPFELVMKGNKVTTSPAVRMQISYEITRLSFEGERRG